MIFPTKDLESNAYYHRVVPYLTTNQTRLTVTTADLTTLTSLFTDWKTYFPLSQNPDAATSAIIAQKTTLRNSIETLLRKIYGDIPESVLTQDDRSTLNLAVRDTTYTPAAKPDRAPVVTVNTISHLQHELKFHDPNNPHTQAKPDGVGTVEVYMAIMTTGTSPAGASFQHAASTGKFLATIDFQQTDVGKTAYYIARYKSTRGEFGPYSTTVNALIA